MNNHFFRFLLASVGVILLCSTVPAASLEITVQDALGNTTIAEAAVFLENSYQGRTDSGGKFVLTHSGDTILDMRITRSGFADWESAVGMDVLSLVVNMTRKTIFLKVRLYDSDTLSPVSDATVELSGDNGSEQKITDSNGFVSFAVNPNTAYDLFVSAQNFQSQATRSIGIGTTDKEVRYWLTRNDRFSFVVIDNNSIAVEGAEVSVNSILMGTTDPRGILFLEVERDTPCVIEVKKDGYLEYSEQRTIGAEEAFVSIVLRRASIEAFVLVYDEHHVPVEGAAVSLGGRTAGFTGADGKYIFKNLNTGTYGLGIRKEGYRALDQEITIAGQDDEFTVEVPFDQTELTIIVHDKEQKPVSGARVHVNGNEAGLSSETGEYVTTVSYNTGTGITVTKEGYRTTSVKETVIIGNVTPSMIVILDKETERSYIVPVVIGAAVILIIIAVIRHRRTRPRIQLKRREEI